MARKKVNLQFITNTLSRRATYKRRCQGLMKKASELAALCGAKACVVVYGEGKAQPEVWPSYEEARRLLKKYRDMPEFVGRFKKAENQKDFLGGRVSKLRGMVDRSESENNKREALDILNERMNGGRLGLFGTNTKVLNSLHEVVTERKSEAIERLRELGAGAPLEPRRVQLLPAGSCSSLQPQDHNTQQVPPNGGVLGTLPSGAFFPGSSSGCAGASTSGGDMMMQPSYSPGRCSEFPWTWEWDAFPPME